MKPGGVGDSCTRNIVVENSHFEYGHGCSIGSVGKGCVENVIFRNITMKNQQNGCRVKTYSNQAGHVHNVTWQDIKMEGVDQCLTVNANYKPAPKHPTDFIDVKGLTFRNVEGTDCRKEPEFLCPEEAPCRDILIEDVQLKGGKTKSFDMDCEHAYGKDAGTVKPKSCLKK